MDSRTLFSRSTFRLFLAVPLLFAALVACAPDQGAADDAQAFTAVVERCGDGDSLDVRDQDNARYTLRLHGIDCPELHQQYGPQALAATEALVLGQRVEVHVLETDRYGRLISLVFLEDGSCLNQVLARQGHAWVSSLHCTEEYCDDWFADQDAARDGGLGLWSAAHPEAPWRWRQDHPRQ